MTPLKKCPSTIPPSALLISDSRARISCRVKIRGETGIPIVLCHRENSEMSPHHLMLSALPLSANGQTTSCQAYTHFPEAVRLIPSTLKKQFAKLVRPFLFWLYPGNSHDRAFSAFCDREAGASAACRGQRPFPTFCPLSSANLRVCVLPVSTGLRRRGGSYAIQCTFGALSRRTQSSCLGTALLRSGTGFIDYCAPPACSLHRHDQPISLLA